MLNPENYDLSMKKRNVNSQIPSYARHCDLKQHLVFQNFSVSNILRSHREVKPGKKGAPMGHETTK